MISRHDFKFKHLNPILIFGWNFRTVWVSNPQSSRHNQSRRPLGQSSRKCQLICSYIFRSNNGNLAFTAFRWLWQEPGSQSKHKIESRNCRNHIATTLLFSTGQWLGVGFIAWCMSISSIPWSHGTIGWFRWNQWNIIAWHWIVGVNWARVTRSGRTRAGIIAVAFSSGIELVHFSLLITHRIVQKLNKFNYKNYKNKGFPLLFVS